MERFKNFIHNLYPSQADVIHDIMSQFEYKEYDKGTELLRINQRPHYLYFIEEGLIRSYFFSHKDREMTHGFFIESELITAAHSFFNQLPSDIGLECIEDTKVFRISLQNFKMLCDKYPKINDIKFGFLLFILHRNSQRMMNNFTMTAQERYQQLLNYVPEIFNRASLGDIATYLGMSQETLSRIRAKY